MQICKYYGLIFNILIHSIGKYCDKYCATYPIELRHISVSLFQSWAIYCKGLSIILSFQNHASNIKLDF